MLMMMVMLMMRVLVRVLVGLRGRLLVGVVRHRLLLALSRLPLALVVKLLLVRGARKRMPRRTVGGAAGRVAGRARGARGRGGRAGG